MPVAHATYFLYIRAMSHRCSFTHVAFAVRLAHSCEVDQAILCFTISLLCVIRTAKAVSVPLHPFHVVKMSLYPVDIFQVACA